MRKRYERMVVLANEGARDMGFPDVGDMWRAGYDMPPDAFFADPAMIAAVVGTRPGT